MNKVLSLKVSIAMATLLLSGYQVQAELWTGAGDGVSYEDAANWNPSATAFPGSSRDVDGTFTVDRNVGVTVSRTFVDGGAILNVSSGTHSDSQSGNTIRNYVGNNSAGTVNQSGGSWNIGHILLIGSGNSSGNGIYNLTGGGLIVGRGGNSFMGVPGGSSLEIGVGSANGLFEVSGGSLATRIGVGVGPQGTFSVLGSATSSIGIGSHGSLDGDWNQASGGTLRVGIDAGGVTRILIDDEGDDGGAYATFESGSFLDVGFINGMTNGGTWTVMEVEGTNITDNGLAFAAGVDTNIWSFAVDNSGANGLLTVTAEGTPSDSTIVSSIAALQQVASSNNVSVKMMPGTYWLTGPSIRPAPYANYAIFLDLSGSNSTFDFTGVHIKVDTQELDGYGRAYGHDSGVQVLQVSGDGVVVDGLTLSMEKLSYDGVDQFGNPREYSADWSSQLVRVTGSNTTIKNCNLTTGGSYPYGYGDAFGKGNRPTDSEGNTDAAYIAHSKQSGFLITDGASNVTVDGVILNMRSFGHGFFMQKGAGNILFKECQALGDTMADSDDIIAHPEYQEWGFATYKEPIPADIRISKHEDAFRTYGNSDHANNGYPENIYNVTITNCVAERMRNATPVHAEGYCRIYDTEVYDCEMGLTANSIGESTILNCKGTARNGPLVYFQYSVIQPATYEVELTGDTPGHGIWPISLISGVGNQITITSSAAPGVYSKEAYVNVSQRWREWRHRPSGDLDELSSGNYGAATTGNFITNLTDQILVFGVNATDNTNCVSTGGVINKGSDNEYVGETLVPGPIIVQDTWSYPPNPTNVPWAQWDSGGNLILPTPPVTIFDGVMYVDDAQTLGGSPIGDGGTTVSNGTIEVKPGFALQGEHLRLSGNGSTGQGAVYSDGQANNKTRLSSSSGSITLEGETSIGVGIVGNELLMGPMSGIGGLIKIGAGTLTLEGGGNSFDGAVVISNGWIKCRSNKVLNDLIIDTGAGLMQHGNNGLNQSVDDTTVVNGTIDINGRGITDTGAYSINMGSLSGTGMITATSTAATQTVNVSSTTSDSSFDGSVTGMLKLNKNGAGTTLAMNGASTHTEGTFVNAGLLGGTGSIAGDVTVNDAAGFEVNFTSPLVVGGTLTFVGTSFEILFPAGAPGFDSGVSNAWKIVEASAVSGFSASSFTVDASVYDPEGGTFAVSESGGDLYLNFEPKPYSALEAWRFEHFGSYDNSGNAADTANPDGDTRNNLVEYATGSDPNVFNTNSAATLGFNLDESRMTLTFNRIDDPLLIYSVEAESSLLSNGWNTIWMSTGASNTTGSVTVEDNEDISNHWKRFLRLMLEY